MKCVGMKNTNRSKEEMAMLRIGLDTESLHLWLQNKRMDIFGFIETAHQFGADGVMINLIKD